MEPEDFTFGIEEEYQLVRRAGGALASAADTVLATDWSDELEGELQETMLEIGTPVCTSPAEARAQLRRLRAQVGAATAAHELAPVAAGLHPFSRWEEQQLAMTERPRMLAERFGRVVLDEHLFGMHVHVSVPEGRSRVELLGEVSGYTPHLLALSASSPFYEGMDTGYASYRTILYRRFPFSGAPPAFRSAREYEHFVGALLSAGMVPDLRTLYWSVRLSPRYPTLEFRVCDVCPRWDDAVAVACLARTIVAAAAEGALPPFPAPDAVGAVPLDLLRHENEWYAARDGLDATLADPSAPGGVRPLRESLGGLLRELTPVAEGLGSAEALQGVREIVERGNAAERMRAVAGREGGDLSRLVEWLASETVLGAGLDRRRAQRPGEE